MRAPSSVGSKQAADERLDEYRCVAKARRAAEPVPIIPVMSEAMKLALRILLVAPMFLPGLASSQEAAPYPVRDCGQLTAQMELNACAGANFKAADAALNRIYQRVLSEQASGAAKDQLKEVERVWLAYRDKECALEVGPQQEGGSIWPMEMSNCLEEKTSVRIRELGKLGNCAAGACGSR
jgi:uncharacterized protein YecT (DUF1311 family)